MEIVVYHSHIFSESEGYDHGMQIVCVLLVHLALLFVYHHTYTNVPPVSINTKEFTAPAVGDHVRSDTLLNVEMAKRNISNGLPVLW